MTGTVSWITKMLIWFVHRFPAYAPSISINKPPNFLWGLTEFYFHKSVLPHPSIKKAKGNLQMKAGAVINIHAQLLCH